MALRADRHVRRCPSAAGPAPGFLIHAPPDFFQAHGADLRAALEKDLEIPSRLLSLLQRIRHDVTVSSDETTEATADTVAARPGWDSLDALANGGVIEMDDDVASRWGPRIVDYLELAGAAVSRAAAVRAG